MLLWHGSRLTNWVGILSQGLRIAPPEAPVTGYMVRNLEYQLGGDLKSWAENSPSRGSCHRIYGKKFRIPTGWGS